MSSLRIPPGFKVELYADAREENEQGGGGKYRTLTADADYLDGGWNGMVTSARVYKQP